MLLYTIHWVTKEHTKMSQSLRCQNRKKCPSPLRLFKKKKTQSLQNISFLTFIRILNTTNAKLQN